MGARFDRLRCEVFQNLFLSPMNTGFVRPAVATVPTVYGIETTFPLTKAEARKVATVPTVYGIETLTNSPLLYTLNVATVPTVYGIETKHKKDLGAIKPLGCNSTYRLRY